MTFEIGLVVRIPATITTLATIKGGATKIRLRLCNTGGRMSGGSCTSLRKTRYEKWGERWSSTTTYGMGLGRTRRTLWVR